MAETFRCKTLSITIKRPPAEVYDYVINPENLPEWVTSFCLSVRESGDEWIMETTEGPMSIKFIERNNYGILDHYVRISSGQVFLNPVRVIPNGSGSELLFTLFQPANMPDEKIAADSANVEKDLETLKRVLEKGQ